MHPWKMHPCKMHPAILTFVPPQYVAWERKKLSLFPKTFQITSFYALDRFFHLELKNTRARWRNVKNGIIRVRTWKRISEFTPEKNRTCVHMKVANGGFVEVTNWNGTRKRIPDQKNSSVTSAARDSWEATIWGNTFRGTSWRAKSRRVKNWAKTEQEDKTRYNI